MHTLSSYRISLRWVVIVLVASIGLSLCGTSTAYGSSSRDEISKVVVFFMPRVTWDDLRDVKTPHLDALIDQGSVANMSVRVYGAPLPAKSYATLSSGMRASAVDSTSAAFLSPEEKVQGDNALDVYVSQRGPVVGKNIAGVGINFQRILSANETEINEAHLGLFADVLAKNDKSLAVFGNADRCVTDALSCRDRSVSLFASTSDGLVRHGDISRDILSPFDESVSTQLSTDDTVLASKVKDSYRKHDVTAVECSDIERVDAARLTTKEEIYQRDKKNAIQKCDRLIGEVMESVSLSRDRVYVISPIAPRQAEQLTVFVAAGNGVVRGVASSATTRVKGIVSLVDVAPTILDGFGITRPATMGDTLIDWHASSASYESRASQLRDINDHALVREQTVKPVTWFIVIMFVLTVCVSLLALVRSNKLKRLSQFLCYTTAALAFSTYVLQPFMVSLHTATRVNIAMVALSVVLGAAMMLASRKWRWERVFLVFSSVFLIVLIGDIVSGGRLQRDSIFGNATIVAGRFAGWNNAAFAFVCVATLLVIAMVHLVAPKASPKSLRMINWFSIGLFFFVIVIDGIPYFGSDVGGILALTPTLIYLAMKLFKKKVGLKTLFLSFGATVVTIGAFTAIDLTRPEEKRTHLGRYAQSLLDGKGGTTIRRKLAASVSSFHRPELNIVAITAALALVFLIFHHRKYFATLIRQYPGLTFLFGPGVLLSFLGTVLNDSGLSVAAYMMLVALPVIFIGVCETDTQVRNE